MKNNINWNFDNSYFRLPDIFRENIRPFSVKKPNLILLNKNLAEALNLNLSQIENKDLSLIFSGNSLPEGSNSIAQAYAGHQFGHFTMLGDGRATLIGEHITKNNKRFDIQFKGSGKTSFSRNGDGRAVLGPMLREYVISEAIFKLGIPTTRSLAVVETGEEVIRDKSLPGAILTRVAESHIRVGTFQYIAARQKKDELQILVNYVIKRHFPELDNKKNKELELLKNVLDRQLDLVVNWMRVGFIHGVMNTDNMSICGETIDYGPCAFMDAYDPKTVFSSIDTLGRYAYCNQPMITKWNLARFAECLIPLIDNDQKKAVQIATEIINTFEKKYEEKWVLMMKNKLGLIGYNNEDKNLILDLLTWMHQKKLDYTNTFLYLMNLDIEKNINFNDYEFKNWKKRWEKRLSNNSHTDEKYTEIMKRNNPVVIPRNHIVENALNFANQGDLEPTVKLIDILSKPYIPQEDIKDYQQPSRSNEKYQTFCGT